MNKGLKIKMVLMICLITISANAQRVLTLDECHRLALENNKKLKVAEAEVDKARYEMYASYANYLPKVGVTGTYTHNSRNIQLLSDENIAALNSIGTTTQSQIDAYREELLAVYQNDPAAAIAWTLLQNDPTVNKLVTDLMTADVEDALNEIGQQVSDAFNVDMRNVYVGMLTIEQPVFTGGKIYAYNQITKDLKELAESKQEMQQQETVVTAEKAYWQIVSIANKMKLAQSYAETLRSLSKDMDKLVAEGVANTSDPPSLKPLSSKSLSIRSSCELLTYPTAIS